MSLFYGVSLFSTGLLIPFFPLVLSEKGLDAQSIGYLLAAPYLLRLFTLPMIGRLTDRLPDRRIVLAALGVLAAVFAWAFMMTSARAGLFTFAALMIVTSQAMTPVTDSIALNLERRGLGAYGRMRLWGSATFILANMAGGAMLGVFGPNVVFDCMIASMGITALFVWFLPSSRPGAAVNPGAASALTLPSLRHGPFLVVLIAAGLIQASHAALYGFATIAWERRSYSEFLIGNLWALGVIAEIILFAAGPIVLRRMPPTRLLLLAGAISLVRWLLFPLDFGPVFAGLVQVMHAGSFACAHLGVMRYISDVVSDEKATSAQGSYMILSGLAMAASTAMAGPLFKAYGAHAFMAMSLFSLLALMLLLTRRLAGQGRTGIVRLG